MVAPKNETDKFDNLKQTNKTAENNEGRARNEQPYTQERMEDRQRREADSKRAEQKANTDKRDYATVEDGVIIGGERHDAGSVVSLTEEEVNRLRRNGIALVESDDDVEEYDADGGFEYTDAETGKVVVPENLDEYDIDNADRVFDGRPEIAQD